VRLPADHAYSVAMSVRKADSAHPPPRVTALPGRLPDLSDGACIDHPYLSENAWTGARASYRDRELARAVCGGCAVLSACREWGTGPVGGIVNGIIGGLSGSERRQIRRQRQVAR